jgi:predicted Zn-dependent protease
MNQPSYLTEDEARELTRRVLAMSRADQARVNLDSGRDRNTRFANNQVTTSGDTLDAALTVTSAFGTRLGSATTNRFDDESLRRVVETSERLARLAPEDPEYLGELGAQTYPTTSAAWFESTVGLDPVSRAAAIQTVSRAAETQDLVSTGFFPVRASAQAVATSRGLFAYHRATGCSFSTTVRTHDGTGSGWAGVGQHDWTAVDVEELARTAVDKARRSRDPQPVEPGRWTVILEPQAVGSLVGFLFPQMQAREADEGRSFFARAGGGTRLGDRLFDERVTIYSDPADDALFSAPFDNHGLPNRRTTWFERGTLHNLIYDRYWAHRHGRAPTGFPSGFLMEGGDSNLEEMIASTERGLLVTRFWYMRAVDQRQILYTGLTRDGTFLVENGRISRPVRNLRWNESPVRLLTEIELIGESRRILPSEAGSVGTAVVVPPLKVRTFNFTSVSDAV